MVIDSKPPESSNEDTDELVIDSNDEKMGDEIKIDIDQSPTLGASKHNGKSYHTIQFVSYDTHCRTI